MIVIRKAFLPIILILFQLTAFAEEIKVYNPYGNTEELYDITNFSDYENITNLAAAQDSLALGLLYGSGEKFEPESNFLNSYALRLIYRTVGREHEGFEASANTAYRQEAGLTAYDNSAWADGFYILALKDGLISANQFVDAYSDDNNELSKSRYVSVQNFIKWMCRIHNVPVGNKSIPKNIYIDPEYTEYYQGIINEGIMTVDEIIKYIDWRYITKSDIAEILMRFEGYIFEKIGIEVFKGNVDLIYENYSGDEIIREITINGNNDKIKVRTKLKKDVHVFAQLKHEIPVFGKNRADTSGSIRVGDVVKSYIKDNKILFLRVVAKSPVLEYIKNPVVYKGKLFLYDYSTGSIVLDNVKKVKAAAEEGIFGYQTFYLNNNVRFFYQGDEIDRGTINSDLIDKNCIIYLNYDYAGGVETVRSVIID